MTCQGEERPETWGTHGGSCRGSAAEAPPPEASGMRRAGPGCRGDAAGRASLLGGPSR